MALSDRRPLVWPGAPALLPTTMTLTATYLGVTHSLDNDEATLTVNMDWILLD